MYRRLLCALALVLCLGMVVPYAQAQTIEYFTNSNYNYLHHLPQTYDDVTTKSWPFMLFLHGAGERGSNLSKLLNNGPPKIAQSDPDFPFILVAPQVPTDAWWNASTINNLLNEILPGYRYDPDHMIVTGLSMGGNGTYALATAYPDRWSAIVPIAAWYDGMGSVAYKIADKPVWAFHGALDTTIALSQGQAAVEALKSVGCKVQLTIYPSRGHDSWTPTYNNPFLYEWMLDPFTLNPPFVETVSPAKEDYVSWGGLKQIAVTLDNPATGVTTESLTIECSDPTVKVNVLSVSGSGTGPYVFTTDFDGAQFDSSGTGAGSSTMIESFSYDSDSTLQSRWSLSGNFTAINLETSDTPPNGDGKAAKITTDWSWAQALSNSPENSNISGSTHIALWGKSESTFSPGTDKHVILQLYGTSGMSETLVTLGQDWEYQMIPITDFNGTFDWTNITQIRFLQMNGDYGSEQPGYSWIDNMKAVESAEEGVLATFTVKFNEAGNVRSPLNPDNYVEDDWTYKYVEGDAAGADTWRPYR